MKHIPLPVKVVGYLVCMALVSIASSFVWQWADTTGFFEGAYGDARRCICGAFSMAMGLVGLIGLFVMIAKETDL